MPRQNPPLLSFNRGIISEKALGRVDLDRVRLSAEVMRNFLAKTQGAMTMRPGTKHFGSSLRDTGAYWVEFVAATDDVALLELANDTGTSAGSMRVWLGSDPHALSLLQRPPVDTTVTLTDTGWDDNSSGGVLISGSSTDVVPMMTSHVTGGVTISASSEDTDLDVNGGPVWRAFDDSGGTRWADTGIGGSALPSWLNVDFDTGANGSDAKAITSYSIRAFTLADSLDNAPTAWRLITGSHDTGTFATDTGKWTLVDERSGQTGWAVGEKRTFTRPDADTGTVEAQRHWRLFFTAVDGDTELFIGEVEMFTAIAQSQADVRAGELYLNATSIGARAKYQKQVVISDTGTEHALAINVRRGPVTLRVGSSQGNDDYISETSLGTGHHNLAFTPTSNFHVTLQNDDIIDRIVSSLTISDTGTVEVQSPWVAINLDDVRFDQSADVVYVDCADVAPHKIERRGTGRSWSVVGYEPNAGPFLASPSSRAKLSVSHFYGNTTLNSDVPVFTTGHVGALIRVFHETQSGEWPLGALDAKTDAVAVTGISDTGTTPPTDSERAIVFGVTGTGVFSTTIEKSVDGEDVGFRAISSSVSTATDTGTRSVTIIDKDDNIKVWYRLRIASYTSGVAVATIAYQGGGGVTGVARITGYNSNTDVDIEVLSRFSDTGPSENWQEGRWSGVRGYPSAVALHSGRLFHASGGMLDGSVSDDFENFDDTTVGDAGPIIRTLGSGPVDNIYFLLSLLRLIIGTTGAELALRSSSLDEPVTPDNSAARSFATNGSANLRALKIDNRGIHLQRSKQRLFMVGFGTTAQTIGDFEGQELTLLVPDLLAAGVVSIAVQRMPDTRIHCVLADGTVGLLTYEPTEEVVCWQTWTTNGSVERAMVLPGVSEDAIYYHVRRTIGSGNDQYTKILLHFDGPDGATTFHDSNQNTGRTWTAGGDAQIDTAQSVFGGASALFDGTGDYISAPDNADFALESDDFTIDCRFQVNAASGTYRVIASQMDSSDASTDSAWELRRENADKIKFIWVDGTTVNAFSSATSFTDSVNTGWHHIAIARNGSDLYMFIDGVLDASTTISTSINDSSVPLSIGRRQSGFGSYLGWIDEFRLSVGIARWTANFTPPTAPYGSVKRFLEKWAKESECFGDTGLCFIMDCASSYTDTGRTNTLTDIATHLPNTDVVLWGDLDTGSFPFVDLSPDTGSDFSQTLHTVDTGGDITLSLTDGMHHAVAGLPYSAAWKGTKLAYAAQLGTALTQKKRVPQLGLVLYKTHNNGLYMGSDTGIAAMQPLPRTLDEGAAVDADKIYRTLDEVAFAVPGRWNSDSRVALRAKAPRPATVLAAVPTVETNEK